MASPLSFFFEMRSFLSIALLLVIVLTGTRVVAAFPTGQDADKEADVELMDMESQEIIPLPPKRQRRECTGLDGHGSSAYSEPLPAEPSIPETLYSGAGADVDVTQSAYRRAIHDWQRKLLEASYRGDVESVRNLVEIGSGSVLNFQDAEGNSPLSLAAFAGRNAVVDLLLGAGADPDYRSKLGGVTPLMASIHAQHATISLKLLQSGADPRLGDTVYGWTAMHFAASKSHSFFLFRKLCDYPDLWNQPDRRGNTPLMVAILKRNYGIFLLSRQFPADPHRRQAIAAQIAQKTPPERIKFAQVFRELRDRVPLFELNAQNGEGRTALHMAVEQMHLPTIHHLLNAGADGSIVNQYGISAMVSFRNQIVLQFPHARDLVDRIMSGKYNLFTALQAEKTSDEIAAEAINVTG